MKSLQQTINRSAPCRCWNQQTQQQLWNLGFAKCRNLCAPSFLPFLGHIYQPRAPFPAPAVVPRAGDALTYGSRGIWFHASLAGPQSNQGCYWIIYHSYYSPLLSFISLGIVFLPPPYFSGERKMLCILFLKLSPAAIPIQYFPRLSSPIHKF